MPLMSLTEKEKERVKIEKDRILKIEVNLCSERRQSMKVKFFTSQLENLEDIHR